MSAYTATITLVNKAKVFTVEVEADSVEQAKKNAADLADRQGFVVESVEVV